MSKRWHLLKYFTTVWLNFAGYEAREGVLWLNEWNKFQYPLCINSMPGGVNIAHNLIAFLKRKSMGFCGIWGLTFKAQSISFKFLRIWNSWNFSIGQCTKNWKNILSCFQFTFDITQVFINIVSTEPGVRNRYYFLSIKIKTARGIKIRQKTFILRNP